jgi:hypothetical protein
MYVLESNHFLLNGHKKSDRKPTVLVVELGTNHCFLMIKDRLQILSYKHPHIDEV